MTSMVDENVNTVNVPSAAPIIAEEKKVEPAVHALPADVSSKVDPNTRMYTYIYTRAYIPSSLHIYV